MTMELIEHKETETILIERNSEEIKKIEQILGWRLYRFPENRIKRKLIKEKKFQVIELNSGEKIFLINLPELTLDEAKILQEVLIKIQKSELQPGKEAIQKSLLEHCLKNCLKLDEEQVDYLNKYLELLIFDFGALSEINENEEIEEISVIGLGENNPVRVFHKEFGWIKTNLYYCSAKTIKNLVNKMARKLGKQLSFQSPNLNASLPDGSRLSAIIDPISFSGPSVTIRKFKKKALTPVDLIKRSTVSVEILAFLWLALETDSSMLVAGNTGSGKTTTMNSLFNFVPENERIIVTEETPEIKLNHEHLVKLRVVENLSVKMNDLIIETLRMRPDRIIVGEIRNEEEVSAFLDTLLAGQGKGAYATFHAQTGMEALKRLQKLGVNKLDLNALDLILVQRRWNKIDLKKNERKEERKIIELSEIIETEKGIQLNQLFAFNYQKNLFVKVNESVKVKEKIKNSFSFTENEFQKELEYRKQVLESLLLEELNDKEFFEKINSKKEIIKEKKETEKGLKERLEMDLNPFAKYLK